jgi:phosphate transport system permease protein
MTTATASPRAKLRPADRIFSSATLVAGSLILVVLAAVAVFLIAQSIPALVADPATLKGSPASFWAYVIPLAFGSVWAAFLALLMALPISFGIALFISHYAPRRVAQGLGYIIDLLAAVPSVVFGLWGIKVLAPAVTPLYQWLNGNLGWIPFFSELSGTGRTILTVAIVLAVMIIPIITAVSREVFLQTPRLHEEAALALGATRWEMIQMAVIPFGRPGMISAAMLGLGRALGETMVVAMVLSPSPSLITFILTGSQNSSTIAGNIALNFPEAHGVDVNALIATGLILFGITLVINSIARVVINRRKAFSGAN